MPTLNLKPRIFSGKAPKRRVGKTYVEAAMIIKGNTIRVADIANPDNKKLWFLVILSETRRVTGEGHKPYDWDFHCVIVTDGEVWYKTSYEPYAGDPVGVYECDKERARKAILEFLSGDNNDTV